MASLTIEEMIKDRIDEMDLSKMVRDEIRSMIHPMVTGEIFDQARKKVDQIVAQEIDTQMRKGVKTDDGWGNRKEYKSFEDLFRATFRERMDKSWDVQREIKRWTEEKVDQMVKSNKDALIRKLLDSMSLAMDKKAKIADSDDLPI